MARENKIGKPNGHFSAGSQSSTSHELVLLMPYPQQIIHL
jgi:hypothetical protein